MNDIQQYGGPPAMMPSHSNVQAGTTVNAGTAMTEQSRAVAETLGKMQVAKSFPRNENEAYAKIMEACGRPAFAQTALYSYPKGGQQVSGPSIRMAELMIRCWSNCETGLKELSQRDGESEMMAYAWDQETNTTFVKNFTVKHERKARGKTQKLNDQRDIYEQTANNGSRRQRAVMLAIIPDYIVEEAVATVKNTMAGGSSEPIGDRIRKMISAFGKFGVTNEMIEKYVGHEASLIDQDELADLIGVFNGIKDGSFKPSQYFSDLKKEDTSAIDKANETIDNTPPPVVEDTPEQRKKTSRKEV